MEPKKLIYNEDKINSSYIPITIREIRTLFEKELEPIIKVLLDENTERDIKNILKKYAVIYIATLIERFCAYNIREIIDKEKINIAHLISKRNHESKNDEDNTLSSSYTDGEKVVSTFNFTSYDIINWVFSRILSVRFFELIFAMDKSDQYRFYGSNKEKTIYRDQFNKIFDDRHKIIHQLFSPEYSDNYLISRLNDTMNFFDAASALCWKDSRNKFIKDYPQYKL